MKIIIDADFDVNGKILAEQSIETDRRPSNKVQHPTLPAQIDTIDFLAWLQVNRGFLESAGFNVPTKLAGFPPGTTRWQVLVAVINASQDASLKALNLIP